MRNNLIIGNLHRLSIFFKEHEIVKEIEPQEAEEIPVAKVEEALPVEGISSTYLEAFLSLLCCFVLAVSFFSRVPVCCRFLCNSSSVIMFWKWVLIS